MKWNVEYTEDAERDFDGIYEYFSGVRLETAAAVKLLRDLKQAADSLEFMPLRCPNYPNEPWKSRGLRVLHKHKYAIVYLPDETTKTVSVVRVVYGGRDVDTELGE